MIDVPLLHSDVLLSRQKCLGNTPTEAGQLATVTVAKQVAHSRDTR